MALEALENDRDLKVATVAKSTTLTAVLFDVDAPAGLHDAILKPTRVI